MNSSTKAKLINLALLLSFSLPLLGPFLASTRVRWQLLQPLSAGLILTLFYREVAVERFMINQETKNKHLKEFFAGGNREWGTGLSP